MIHLSRRAGVAAVAALTVVGGGLFAASSTAGEDRYRTAEATKGDVEQVVTHDGTIAASNRSDLVFATGGTVKKVAVEVGDEVAAGDVLATLDASDLRAAVIEARADLADAEAYLEDVEDGQIDTVTRAAGGGGNATESSAADSGTVAPALYSASASLTATFASTGDRLKDKVAELVAQQEAVKSAQSDATEAIAAAKSALAAQQEACEEQDTADETAISQECQDALTTVQDAQDVVAQKQDALQSALEKLGSTLDEAVAQLEKEAAGSTGGSGGGDDKKGDTKDEDSGKDQDQKSGGDAGGAPEKGEQPKSKDSGSGSGSAPGGSSGTTATASDLASAQADVDEAEAALASAKADLAAATLTAPFDGTVMSVSVAAGDEVSASDAALVLIGEGDTTATASVPVEDLAAIEVGQAASVTPGSATAASGTVSAIGLVPESSDTQSSTTTYRVTVTLDDDLAAPEGSAAVVSIVTGAASDVVTVPVSAVSRRTATEGSVLVLADGEVERRQVTLGAMGATLAAVTEGVEEGEQVVLADLDAALPSSDTADTRSLTGGGGRGGPPSGGGAPGGRPPG